MKTTTLALLTTLLAACQAPDPGVTLGSETAADTQPPPTVNPWPQLPDGIKTITLSASQALGIYGNINTTIGIVKTLLQWAGLLPTAPSTTKLLADIAAQIDSLASGVTWQIAETDRENLSTQALGDVLGAVQWLETHDNQPLPVDSPQAQESLDAVVQSEKPVAFNRYFLDSIISPNWKNSIPDRPTVTNGFVYDWRLGVPSLLHTLSMRIQVIAAEDPSFKTDTTFFSELTLHRSQLQTQLANMVGGLRCGALVAWSDKGPNYVEPRCADINTGAYNGQDFAGGVNLSSCTHGSYVDQQCRTSLYNGWYAQAVQPVLDSLRRQVRVQMAVFDLQAMIDTLYMYTHPAQPELTVKYQRIPAAGNTSLCLDVKGGSSASGTPVQLWTCNASAAQRWSYDRATQRVTNTAFGKCLDVSGADVTPGTKVQIWDCNGTDAQRWTWNPETGALESARGNVLDIAGGNLAAGTTVWTWTKNGSMAQKWLADAYTPINNL